MVTIIFWMSIFMAAAGLLGIFIKQDSDNFQTITFFLMFFAFSLAIVNSFLYSTDSGELSDRDKAVKTYTDTALSSYKNQAQKLDGWGPDVKDSDLISQADATLGALSSLIALRRQQKIAFQARNVTQATINSDAQDIIQELDPQLTLYNNNLSTWNNMLQVVRNEYTGSNQVNTISRVDFDSILGQLSTTFSPPVTLTPNDQLLFYFSQFISTYVPLENILEGFWGRNITSYFQNIVQNCGSQIDTFLSYVKENTGNSNNLLFFTSLPFPNATASKICVTNHSVSFVTNGNQYNLLLKIAQNPGGITLNQLVQQTSQRMIEFYSQFCPIIINGLFEIAEKLQLTNIEELFDSDIHCKRTEQEILLYNSSQNVSSNFQIYFSVSKNLAVYVLNLVQNQVLAPSICYCFKPNYIFSNSGKDSIYDFTGNTSGQKLIFDISSTPPQITTMTIEKQQKISITEIPTTNNLQKIAYFGLFSNAPTVKFDLWVNNLQLFVTSTLPTTGFSHVFIIQYPGKMIVCIFNQAGYFVQKFQQIGSQYVAQPTSIVYKI